MFRERARANWSVVALVLPPVHQALALLEKDTGFLAGFLDSFMGPDRRGHRAFDGVPELAPIADREAGLVILFAVMPRDEAGESVAVAPLAREFQVSRAHIRSILQAAEVLGMLARAGPACDYRLEPRFRTLIGRAAASMCQTYTCAIDRTLAVYRPVSPPPTP